MTSAAKLVGLLGLAKQPVAIAFRESAPDGVDRIDSTAVSGCTYWKYASEGKTFYTEPPDHYGCPIGAHTHGVEMPEETAKELEGLIGTMVELQYIDMAEVPDIPHREEPFGVVVYAPLVNAGFEPDAIMITGTAKQMMLLSEAAQAAGVACETSIVGRPTCAAIPAVMQSGKTATNLGCIGNRVYTGITDDELYFVLAGAELSRLVEKLQIIVNANLELEKFHLARAN